ncbi:MAG: hypothetical protein ACREUU_01295, partial [Gammaproteobacteria bacterium]
MKQIAVALLGACPILSGQGIELAGLELALVRAEVVEHRGRKAIRVTESGPRPEGPSAAIAYIKGSDFKDGTIEVELAGEPGPSAAGEARGFAGMAFRASGAKFENIYLRPTNGRAEDQVRRNHSVQYESIPEFPWFRLRKEFPEKYETYADLEPGAWTQYRLVVSGT